MFALKLGHSLMHKFVLNDEYMHTDLYLVFPKAIWKLYYNNYASHVAVNLFLFHRQLNMQLLLSHHINITVPSELFLWLHTLHALDTAAPSTYK